MANEATKPPIPEDLKSKCSWCSGTGRHELPVQWTGPLMQDECSFCGGRGFKLVESDLLERITILTAERDALAEKLKRLSAQVEAGASLDSGNCWYRWGLDPCIRRGDHQLHRTKYGYEWDDSCLCNGRGCTRCCGPS
jgi:hypothetical protein